MAVVAGQWGFGTVGRLGWLDLLSFRIISGLLIPRGFSIGLPSSVARPLAWGLRAQPIDLQA